MKDVTRYANHARTAGVYIAPIVLLLALAVVLNATNPLESGAASILVVFILLYFFIFSVLAAGLHLIASILHMVRPSRTIRTRRGYYVLSIIALAPVLFIALNTLGQLEVLEIILILLLVALGCFYVLRRSQNK